MSSKTRTRPMRSLIKAVGEYDFDAARKMASYWHGGRDHNLTGLSHGTEWRTDGLIRELDQLIEDFNPKHNTPLDLEGLKALRAWADDTHVIISVESSNGHTFTTEDGEENCLSCGGRWSLVHKGPHGASHGRYTNGAGDSPTYCPGHDVTHGEQECHRHKEHHEFELRQLADGSDCPNCTFRCNCDWCRA